MSTQCFFRGPSSATPENVSLGTNAAKLDGTASGWAAPNAFRNARGAGLIAPTATNTVAGTTLGVEIDGGAPSTPIQWISPPLDADVTISGTITFNLWSSENNMSANVAINAIVERIDSQGAIASTVVKTANTVEVAITTRAVNNFTATPTSTAFNKGDRIRVRVFGDDAGTMASGFTFNFSFGATSAAADGDSYVTFTETFGFLTTDPTTTSIYPTNTNSDIDPGGATVDTLEAWTSRGGGKVNAVDFGTGTTGWTAPRQVQHITAGANVCEWYTKPLSAFTLSGPVLLHFRANGQTSNVSAIRAELAITANDGTGATTWGGTSYPSAAISSEAAYDMYVAGDDTAVSDGQRIRVRFYTDDPSTAPQSWGGVNNVLLPYAGAAGATGDTFLTFGQTLTEYVAPGAVLDPMGMTGFFGVST